MILFGGDLHGEFRPIRECALREIPKAVVLLGDFDLSRPLGAEMADVITAGIRVL